MVLKKKKKSTEVETSDLRNESLQCPTPKTRKKKVSWAKERKFLSVISVAEGKNLSQFIHEHAPQKMYK